mgnify:FL=1
MFLFVLQGVYVGATGANVNDLCRYSTVCRRLDMLNEQAVKGIVQTRFACKDGNESW